MCNLFFLKQANKRYVLYGLEFMEKKDLPSAKILRIRRKSITRTRVARQISLSKVNAI